MNSDVHEDSTRSRNQYDWDEILRLLKENNFQSANEKLDQIPDDTLSELLASDNRTTLTAAHNAAMSEAGAQTLLLFVRKVGPICLNRAAGEDRTTPLQLACQIMSGDTIDKLVSSLRRDAKLIESAFQTADAHQHTALHYAAQNLKHEDCFFSLVRSLGSSGPHLHRGNREGMTPVMIAFDQQSKEALNKLISRTPLEDTCFTDADRNGNTAVHYAALRHPSCLLTLVGQLGPDCLAAKNACNVTPLQLTMTSISPDAVKAILQLIELADPKSCILVPNQFGDTVVHFAARDRGQAEALDKLVKKLGLECLSMPNQQMRSPLHYACAAQKAATVAALAKVKGAKKLYLNLSDQNGHKPLHYAARKEERSARATNQPPDVTLARLIDIFGPKCVRVKDDEGNTPLHIACGNLSPAAIEELTKRLDSTPDWRDWFTEGDENGTSAVHYAACSSSHPGSLLKLVDILGPDCLSKENDEGKTPLHLACANQNFETVRDLLDNDDKVKLSLPKSLSNNPKEQIIQQKIRKTDHNGNNAAHYAALNRKHANFLNKLVHTFELSCLCDRNKDGKTPLHIAFCTHTADIVAPLVEIAMNLTMPITDEQKEVKLEAESDAVHQCRECSTHTGNCLTCPDNDGNSVIHYAAGSSSFADILLNLCEHLGSEILLNANSSGITPLHLAVKYSICEPEQVSRLRTILKDDFEKQLELEDKSSRSVLFYACLGHNYNLLSSINPKHKALRGTDENGNTLLHALFLAKWYMLGEAQVPRFLDAMSLLLQAGVDPQEENDCKQNCLHATELYGSSLKAVLTAAASTGRDNIKKHMKSMLLSSEGVHAVHVFFGRYRVSNFLEQLSELAGVSAQSLITLTVRKGHAKGATCLHFACEFGNQENIEYLLLHRQKLSSKTQSGQSCVDYAFDKDKLDRLLSVARMTAERQHSSNRGAKKWTERIVQTILPLIDPPKLALKLPDQNRAGKLIKSISDQSVRSSTERGRAVGLVLDSALNANRRDDSQRTDLLIFHRAVELDSPEILRSMLRLDLLTKKSVEDYATFLHMRKLAIKDKETELYFETRFPQMQEFLKHWMHGGHTSVLEVAAFFEKIAILPDLIITRQLDLIPSCLIVLLHLKPKISSKRGKHEQLKELQRKVLSIVVNAFDLLFINANKEEQKLLFNYIGGRFSVKDDKSEILGPKFPCRIAKSAVLEKHGYSRKMQVEELSIIELVERLDLGDIYSTDCISMFAKQEWNTQQDGTLHLAATPQKKLKIHTVSFAAFLLYYAWFVTDFNRTFANIVPDLLMLGFALSFTAQEVTDIYRRRRCREFYLRPNWVVRLPVYFKDVLNIFDILALVFMWTGMIWKLCIHEVGWQHATVHSCQMVLCSGFLLWGFRSISVLSYFEKIGPVTAMLKNLLLMDLLPFLTILFVIFYTFGVFYFNLLFPVSKTSPGERNAQNYTQKVFQQIFLLPASMLFGYFELLAFEPSNGPNQEIGKVAEPTGLSWFNGLLLFLFMLIVNIVMLNLLIALFNLTVSRMSGQALGIWRQTRFQMLREYQAISTLPPPLSFINYLVRGCVRARQRAKAKMRTGQEPPQPWYRNVSAYPAEYVDFLKFQAVQFRHHRPGKLQQEVGKNRGEIDALKAHTENALNTVYRGLDETVLDLDDRLERLESVASRQRQRLRQLNKKMDQLLEAAAGPAAPEAVKAEGI
ncbi:hypothetical protein BOX15_Mlig018559g1 [Macrostomum lignano]|uniref:Ion transport domain-containing protein n=1 Tax=Macrostomum lignano TaxID=282301 RepID=A0A267GWW6_9PLAT|nr:hypothetical protein BOX15_Mlig018559g1 [Macrostomum lignano]